MGIDDEIMARVRAAQSWDNEREPTTFQIRAAENGCVLINLKTRRAQLIYDEFSHLHDFEQLFPVPYGTNVVSLFPNSAERFDALRRIYRNRE
jgi:hypothetical protein